VVSDIRSYLNLKETLKNERHQKIQFKSERKKEKQRSAPGPLGEFCKKQLAELSYFPFLLLSFFSMPFYNFVFLILLSFLSPLGDSSTLNKKSLFVIK